MVQDPLKSTPKPKFAPL